MSVKIDRLSNTVLEVLSRIIFMETKNPILKNVILTSVSVTNDLSFAKVYFTCMNEDKDKVLTELNEAKGFLRGKLSQNIEIRHTPELIFEFDNSIEYGMNIEKVIAKRNYAKISDILSSNVKNNDKIKILAIVSELKLKTTKNNDSMAFVEIEDMSGHVEIIVFSRVLDQYSKLLREGEIIVFTAKVSSQNGSDIKLICEKISTLENDENLETKPEQKTENSNPRRHGLYIKLKNKDSIDYKKVENLLRIFDGHEPVYFFFSDDKKLVLAPKNLWVDLNDVMVTELKNQIGSENVFIK